MFAVTAALAAATAVGAGTVSASPLTWGSCAPVVGVDADQIPAEPAVECAQLEVPVDYSRPDGRKTTVAVSRMRASGGEPVSTVFGHPGGPGLPTLSYWEPRAGKPRPPGLYENHDLVAVQPRGLSGSNPLRCDPRAVGPVGANALFEACSAADAEYLASMTTENSARDMDSVRAAMGLDRIDFVGQSYGTAVGADYATLFPQHTGRFVLDSNVDPTAAWERQSAMTTLAQQSRVYDEFQWIADRDDFYHLGDTPLKVFTKWKRVTDQEVGGSPNLTPPAAVAADLPVELRGTPLQQPVLDVVNSTAPGRARAEGLWRAVTLQDLLANGMTGLFDVTVGATGTEQAWPMVAHQLRYYEDGGRIARVDYQTAAKILAAKQRPHSALTSEASLFQITTCNETATPTDYAGVAAARIDNLFGGNALVDKAASQAAGGDCLGWRAPARPVPVSGAGLATPPQLVNSQRDARTPMAGATVMRDLMGGALLTVGGGEHGAFRSGNAAVDDAVMRFLAGAPAQDAALPGPPPPTPLPAYGAQDRAAATAKNGPAPMGVAADDWYGAPARQPAQQTQTPQPAPQPQTPQDRVAELAAQANTAVAGVADQVRAAVGVPAAPTTTGIPAR